MGGINIGRWLAGGFAAAVVTFLMEGLWSQFYMDAVTVAMENLGLSMDMTGANWVLAILVSLISGLTLVFFYAAARPRFGPGPITAIKVAVALWIGGYLIMLIGYHMGGFYPDSLLVMWAWQGLISTVLGALVGGWVYREE
jgi:hypothetical protein